MKERGLYVIKDKFFQDMDDPYLKGNKRENRPHYYCFQDSANGVYWMIPMSGKIDKYKKIVDKKEKSGRTCDIIHIDKLDNGKESAFLIQDMFPITEDYIEREYTIAGSHLTITSDHSAMIINRKAKKVLKMLIRGVKFTPTQPNITKILEKLLSDH